VKEGADFVRVQRAGTRATITFNEPERFNALSAALVIQAKSAIAELVDEPGVRSFGADAEHPVCRNADGRSAAPATLAPFVSLGLARRRTKHTQSDRFAEEAFPSLPLTS
jgi:hypothetical protein